MPNINYARSRAKEQQLVRELREQGWFAVITPASKTKIDVLAIKPIECQDHYQVMFHQFKVSENRVNEKEEIKVENIPFPVPVLWHMVPVKSKKWLAGRREQKAKVTK